MLYIYVCINIIQYSLPALILAFFLATILALKSVKPCILAFYFDI